LDGFGVATVGGTLKPSDKVSILNIFKEVIINKDLNDINTLVVGEAFKVLSPSILVESMLTKLSSGKLFFKITYDQCWRMQRFLFHLIGFIAWGLFVNQVWAD
jgi:hypothetical protein